MKPDFTELYCNIDDFIKNNQQNLLAITNCKTKPGPKDSLSQSEILTIIIGYRNSSMDCFKNYYIRIILPLHHHDFKLVSYHQFTKLIGPALPFLTLFLNNLLEKCTGTSFVDSTHHPPFVKLPHLFTHKFLPGLQREVRLLKVGSLG